MWPIAPNDCDPARMARVLELKRDWWVATAAKYRATHQPNLEGLCVEVAAMYNDAITRIREVERRMEITLRDLYWRTELGRAPQREWKWPSNN